MGAGEQKKVVRWAVLVVLGAVVAGVALLAGCRNRGAEQIPLETFFGDPRSEAPRLGYEKPQYLYLAPHEGAMNLWFKTIDGSVDKPLTSRPAPGVQYYYWMPNDEQVLYYFDDPETSVWSLYVVDVETAESRKVAPLEADVDHMVKVRVIETSREHPDDVMVSMNLRDPVARDVYRINTRTLETTLIQEGDERVYKWISDWDFTVRGFVQLTASGGEALWWRTGADAPFKKVIEWEPEDVLNSGVLVVTPDNRGLYLLDSRGRNTGALVTYYPETGETNVLAYDPHYDISRYLIDWKTHTVQAVGYQRARLEWTLLDSSIADDLEMLRNAHEGDLYIPDRLWAGNWWVVMYRQDTGPGSFYLYNQDDMELKFLFDYRPELADVPLAPMEPISFQARDGLTIHGYLTRPLDTNEPAPMVVNVHGGPWKRDEWGYHPETQWLANRGYACLQINFRGSSGYGKKFINAGNREWGGAMLTDLVDGVHWAIDQGVADPDRVAIYGGSYGGYAALSGVTFAPEVWAGGISVVGAPNLVAYLEAIPAYYAGARYLYDQRIGRLPRYDSGPRKGRPKAEADYTQQDREDIAFLKARSPLFHVENIQVPLLIAHGGKDQMVPIEDVNEFVKLTRDQGVEVEYLVYEEEAHGLAHQDNRLDFYRNMESFLDTHVKNAGSGPLRQL